MTREEAIRILRNIAFQFGSVMREDNIQAIDMAIEALQGDMYCPNCGVRLVPENEYLEPTQTHRRLIDADALEKELSKRWDISDDQDFCNKEVWDALRNAPTVQADRPHGEWIVNTDDICGGITLTCSDCGEQFNFDDADEVLDFKEHAHFCINCGAKMGGDKECL